MRTAHAFRSTPLRLARLLAGASVAAAATASSFPASRVSMPQLAGQTYVACLAAMGQDRCVLTQGPQPAAMAAPADVFIAGVGVVPQGVYNTLMASDAQMCERVREACASAPSGAICATAGRLWSVGSPR